MNTDSWIASSPGTADATAAVPAASPAPASSPLSAWLANYQAPSVISSGIAGLQQQQSALDPYFKSGDWAGAWKYAAENPTSNASSILLKPGSFYADRQWTPQDIQAYYAAAQPYWAQITSGLSAADQWELPFAPDDPRAQQYGNYFDRTKGTNWLSPEQLAAAAQQNASFGGAPNLRAFGAMADRAAPGGFEKWGTGITNAVGNWATGGLWGVGGSVMDAAMGDGSWSNVLAKYATNILVPNVSDYLTGATGLASELGATGTKVANAGISGALGAAINGGDPLQGGLGAAAGSLGGAMGSSLGGELGGSFGSFLGGTLGSVGGKTLVGDLFGQSSNGGYTPPSTSGGGMASTGDETSTPAAGTDTTGAGGGLTSTLGDLGGSLFSGFTDSLKGSGPYLALAGLGLAQAKQTQTQNDKRAQTLADAGTPFLQAGQNELTQYQSGQIRPDEQATADLMKSQGQTLIDSASPLASIYQGAFGDYSAGKLPAADEQRIADYVANAKQELRQKLAQQGITDSSILATQDATIDSNALKLRQSLLDQRFSTGNTAYDSWMKGTQAGQQLQRSATQYVTQSIDNHMTNAIKLAGAGLGPLQNSITLAMQNDRALASTTQELMGTLAQAWALSQYQKNNPLGGTSSAGSGTKTGSSSGAKAGGSAGGLGALLSGGWNGIGGNVDLTGGNSGKVPFMFGDAGVTNPFADLGTVGFDPNQAFYGSGGLPTGADFGFGSSDLGDAGWSFNDPIFGSGGYTDYTQGGGG